MNLSWWLWLLLGFVLLVLELLTPGGFFIFFFGVGAIVVGVMTVLGVAGQASVQWLLFVAISVAGFLLFRRPLQERLARRPTHEVDAIIGEVAVTLNDIGVQEVGKAELRGTAWSARNVGSTVLKAGERCRVERVEGLMLWIRGTAA
jgi:inner membrane protein